MCSKTSIDYNKEKTFFVQHGQYYYYYHAAYPALSKQDVKKNEPEKFVDSLYQM